MLGLGLDQTLIKNNSQRAQATRLDEAEGTTLPPSVTSHLVERVPDPCGSRCPHISDREPELGKKCVAQHRVQAFSLTPGESLRPTDTGRQFRQSGFNGLGQLSEKLLLA